MTTTITAAQTREMLRDVAQAVIAAKEQLCAADRNIGDGDHGIGMEKGFEAVLKELEYNDSRDVYSIFSTTGRTMIRVMGGASGIIFGLLFYAGSKNMPEKDSITTAEFAEIFEKALMEIQNKGQAKQGDKTLVDGLVPMVEAMRKSAENGEDFKQFLTHAYEAAEVGKQASTSYIARFGKSKTLGERAIGFPDAGCVSLTVITNAMQQWAQHNL
jgi:dihydroxyacetone kinase phosphoprotein-dependent L subunit